MFDADRAVEVICRAQSAGQTSSYGSGYYIGAGLVLTCAHVLREDRNCESSVRTTRGDYLPFDVLWRNRLHDVALLSVTWPQSLPTIHLHTLPRVTTGESVEFMMIGWPRSGSISEHDRSRDAVQVDGEIKLAEFATSRSARIRLRPLKERYPPLTRDSYWRGLSGAAVFAIMPTPSLIAVQRSQPLAGIPDYLLASALTPDVLELADEHGNSASTILADAEVAFGILLPMSTTSRVSYTRIQPLERASSFVGRREELAEFGGFIKDHRDENRHLVAVHSVEGMAGIGKTALVLEIAAIYGESYGDGHYLIDLHGYTPGVEPLPVAAALEELLIQVGVPKSEIPPTTAQRIARWQGVMRNKRALIILDNALDSSHVLPLLPRSSGCLVLTTSRLHLLGLTGARHVLLDTLSEADAATMFQRLAGPGRSFDPLDVAALIRLVGALPLAIEILAARFAHDSTLTTANLLDDLRLSTALNETSGVRAGIRAALEVSLRRLNENDRRSFVFLGLHPGPEVGVAQFAALLDLSPGHAAASLRALAQQNLIKHGDRVGCSRYVLHDLVSEFVREQATTNISAKERASALSRLVGFYKAAYGYIKAVRDTTSDPLEPTVPGLVLADGAEVQAWLVAERRNLLALAESDATEDVAWIAAVFGERLRHLGYNSSARPLLERAVGLYDAGIGTPSAKAWALNILGGTQKMQAEYAAARDSDRAALDIYVQLGAKTNQGFALRSLGDDYRVDDLNLSLRYYEEALEVFRETGSLWGQASTLLGIGHILRLRGDLEAARARFDEALRIARQTNDTTTETNSLWGLGASHYATGDFATAIDYYQNALGVARRSGDQISQVIAMYGLGHAHRLQGDLRGAEATFLEVWSLSTELAHVGSQIEAHLGLGWIALAEQDLEGARYQYDQALYHAQNVGAVISEACALWGMCQLAKAEGRLEAAQSYRSDALRRCEAVGTTVAEVIKWMDGPSAM